VTTTSKQNGAFDRVRCLLWTVGHHHRDGDSDPVKKVGAFPWHTALSMPINNNECCVFAKHRDRDRDHFLATIRGSAPNWPDLYLELPIILAFPQDPDGGFNAMHAMLLRSYPPFCVTNSNPQRKKDAGSWAMYSYNCNRVLLPLFAF
jgi:hypothetical protein